MHELQVPDIGLLENWLKQAGHDSWMCDRCDGLHVSTLQSQESVLDSRLFLEPYGILFTTEIDLKASSILQVNADMARLNMSLPTLKLFLEVMDNGGTMLVASHVLLTSKGINYSQFCDYIAMALEAKNWLLNECLEQRYLFAGEEDSTAPPHPENKPSLH